MADSNHFTALRDKDKYKDRDRDRENAYKGLSIALAENHAAFSECHASYLSTDSTKPGHEYHCILGPYFFKEVSEAIQMASQLAQHGNVAPYACTREAASWQKQSRKSSGWLLSTKSEWPKWVNRLKTTTYADHWKRAGIYDAIIMSTSSIPLDRALVAAGLCFWNTATNTMDLPGLGMMSPTLLDVAAITGFRPHGKEVSALTIPHPKILNWDAADRYSYSNFMEHYFKANEEEEVKMEEHIAFLLYWLCKYVFCVTSGRVIKEWAGLAEALALSDNIALGPIVLAHLYRGLQKMVQQRLNGKTTTSGPIWLFQMWLQLYFPELAPPLVSYHQAQLLGASLVAATLPDHTLEICFNTLQKCTHRTDDQWSVCLK
ncbi:hypothetical protein ACLB2K_044596 [Fragaria x ananassa]